MNEFFNKVKDFVAGHKKAVIITSVAVLLAVAVLIAVLLLVGGDKPKPNVDPTNGPVQTDPVVEKKEYKVTVKNQIGTALTDVGISVYADDTLNEMVWFGKTDEEGVMSFEAKASDNYVAVLESVSGGYALNESYPITVDTQILLSAGGSSVTEMKGSLSLGDPMPNFTVTTVDGTTYTYSELLAQGKPVVLNFWYENCEPCKAEFPHMQEAYAQFADEIILLCLNTEDKETAIESFAQTSGYDLPFAVADPAWKDLLNIYANPTTVVIDRFGHVSMIHTGTVPDTQVFVNLFAYYIDANYQHTTFATIDDLAAGVPGSSADNPIEFSGAESYLLNMEEGQTIYCSFYRVDGMLMSIANENVSVTYNGETYTAVDGWVKLVVNSPDPFTPVSVVLNNLGGPKTFYVDFSYVPGSMGAPYELGLGPLNTEIAAGNSQGVFYTCTCPAAGKLTLTVVGVTEGVEYDCVFYNQTTSTMVSIAEDGVVDPETGYVTITLDVNVNDVVQLVASSMMDANGEFPAANLDLEVGFTEGEGTVNYTVLVIDKNDLAIPGVRINFTGDGVDMEVRTDAEGKASVALVPGTYTVLPVIPLGYQAEADSFEVTEAAPELTIVLESVVIIIPTEDPEETDPEDMTDPDLPVDPTVPSDPVVPTAPTQTGTDPVPSAPTQGGNTPSAPTQSGSDNTVPTVPTQSWPTNPPATSEPTDPPVVVWPTNPPATSKPTSPPVVWPTNPPATSKPTDPPATVKPTNPPATSKPTDPPATVKPTNPPATSKPTDPPATVKPTNPPATSKPTDPPATEKPTEPTPPATYTPNPEVEGETRENPLWLSNDTSHTVTVKPGYTVYLMKLLVEERHMIISGGDFELVINAPENKRAKTIVSENGQTAQTVKPEGIGNTLYLDLTNTTGKEQTYTISFIAPLGSSANPEKLNLGEWKLEIKKGQDKGYEYTFTATKDGVFTLECLSCTKGVIYFLEVNAPDHEADVANVMKQVRIESTDGNSVSVAIRKGDKITIKLGTLQNTSGVRNPKGKFELKATLE